MSCGGGTIGPQLSFTNRPKISRNGGSCPERRFGLKALQPDVSSALETVGRWGAIHIRLWEARKSLDDLNEALFRPRFYV